MVEKLVKEFVVEAANLIGLAGDQLWTLLNSSFSTALLGAFAGAVGAQYAANKSDRKKRLREEIRSTNAALMVAFSITNFFLGIKKQHIKSLCARYADQKKQIEEAQKAGTQKDRLTVQFDLQVLPPVLVPVDALQKLLFEKISVTGRPLTLSLVLQQCVEGLNNSLKQRNEFIDWCKEQPPNSPAVLRGYFGLRTDDGQDSRYPDAIDGIGTQTDDCIAFSFLIGQDLQEHGAALRKEYGRGAPSIHAVRFDARDELMPDLELYADWRKLAQNSATPNKS